MNDNYVDRTCFAPPLAPDTERLLVAATKCGHESVKRKARNALILHNMRLVTKLAANKEGDFTDLCQNGVLGVHRAIDKYDPRRGAKFSTYATWWIRRYIEDVPKSGVHYPNHLRSQLRRYRNRVEGGDTPKDIAEDARVSSHKVRSLLGLRCVESLEVTRRRGNERRSVPADDDELSDLFTRHAISEEIQDAIRNLDDVDRRLPLMVVLKFWRGMSYREIGERFGISRQRVGQKMKVAFDRLRYRFEDYEGIWQSAF